MTTQELNAQLATLQQSLPEHLRDALDIEQIKLRHSARIQTAREAAPANALVRAVPKSIDTALAAYAANPLLQIVNALLHAFMDTANANLSRLFQTVPVNLFGNPNNRLDPLQFNGAASTSASGSACLPQSCTTFLGVTVCFPPVAICASGGASAGLNTLNGLSTARIANITVADVPAPAGSILTVSGKLALSAGNLSASGFAEAHGGPFGISIPVSASGSAQLTGVSAAANVVITIDLSQPKITALQLSNLSVNYSALNIYISGLGPFNSLIGPLLDGLKSIVQVFFNVNGAISNALQGVLQTQLNNLLK